MTTAESELWTAAQTGCWTARSALADWVTENAETESELELAAGLRLCVRWKWWPYHIHELYPTRRLNGWDWVFSMYESGGQRWGLVEWVFNAVNNHYFRTLPDAIQAVGRVGLAAKKTVEGVV